MSTKRKAVQNRAPRSTQNRAPVPGGIPTNPNMDPMQAIDAGFAAMNQRIDSMMAPDAGAPGAPVTPPVTPPIPDTRAAGDAPVTPPVVPPVTPTAPAPVTNPAAPPTIPAAPAPPLADTRTPAAPLAAPPAAPAPAPVPAMADFQQRFDAGMAGVNERLIGMEQRLVQSRGPAIITNRAAPAIFDALTASDVYKNEFSRGSIGRVENLPSILLEELTEYEQRASTPTVIGSAAVGGLTQPYYRPGIVEYPRERFGLWELLNKMTTDGEKVEVMKESEASSEGGVLNTVEVEIDGDPTPKTTCTLYNTEGFEGGMYVKFHLTASTPRLLLVSNDKATGILTFATDAITFDAAVGTKVTAEAIGATAEEGLKPYGYMDVAVVEEVLKTMATLLKVTVQRMKLAPMLLQWMRTKLMAAAKRSYSWHCLYGDDAQAGQLAGFFSETGAQTYVWSTDGVAGDNQIDAIMKAIDLILSDGVIGITMNKSQWSIVKLLKGTDGHYLSRDFGPVAIVDEGPGQRRLGPHPVELDPSCRYIAGTKSDVLIADFVNAHELYINPNLAAFDLGMINDDFEKNIRRARYEECAQNAILTTKSYVYLNLDSVKT